MKHIISIFVFFLITGMLQAQNMIQGVVIEIKDSRAYLDVTSKSAKVGDVLSIKKDNGYMVHPVSKKKIKKEGEIIADLEIVETFSEYSVATIYPDEAVKLIKVGMVAEMPELPTELKVALPSANLNESAHSAIDLMEADAIVERYLNLIGSSSEEQQSNINAKRPYLNKTVTKFSTLNGSKSSIVTTISQLDLSQRKYFIYNKVVEGKTESIIASALNGDDGYFESNKVCGKYTSAQVSQIWSGVLEGSKKAEQANDFNKYLYTRSFGGKTVRNGKNCSIVTFTSINDGKKTTYYFDDNTGYVVATENDEAVIEVLNYKDYGIGKKTWGKYITKFKVPNNGFDEGETEILEYKFDASWDNKIFSKDGLKKYLKGVTGTTTEASSQIYEKGTFSLYGKKTKNKLEENKKEK